MKEKILITIIAKILEGQMRENDLFSSAIFYYLAGRFPNAIMADCADVVETIRDEYLHGTGFKKGATK